jgi:hypothetical protein
MRRGKDAAMDKTIALSCTQDQALHALSDPKLAFCDVKAHGPCPVERQEQKHIPSFAKPRQNRAHCFAAL